LHEALMKRLTLLVLTLLAPSAGTAATGQPVITFYAQTKYSGPSLRLILPAPDIRKMGFTNTVLSFIVENGRWQLCNQPNFKGSCITVGPGQYPQGYHNGFARTIVSVQPVSQ
jgi:hypothetical protein